MEEGGEKAILNVDVPRSQKIIQTAETRIEFDILEGSGDPELSDGVSWNSKKIFVFIKDLALLGLIETTDAVEEAGLSSSIGADDAQYLSSSQLEADIREGNQIAEAQGHIFHFQMDFTRHWIHSRRT
jgi:hypothetical protein